MNLFRKSDFQFFLSLITEAGALALKYQKEGLEVTRKRDRSIVTQADLAVQSMLVEKIGKHYPDFNFIYEEEFDRDQIDIDADTISVIIDPIDGTAIYSMGLPFWCVSIGIFKGYNPLYGFVFSPGSDLLFYNDNKGSYCNGLEISASPLSLNDSEINIFFASEVHKIFSVEFQGKIRNLGSSALHACLVANSSENRTIAFIGKSFLWDWAGAVPIILKSGAHIRFLNGDNVDFKQVVQNRYEMPRYCIAYSSRDFDSIQKIFSPL